MDSKTPGDYFDMLLTALRERKPNNRSEQDRYWAIVITEVEKARAVYLQLAASSMLPPSEGSA